MTTCAVAAIEMQTLAAAAKHGLADQSHEVYLATGARWEELLDAQANVIASSKLGLRAQLTQLDVLLDHVLGTLREEVADAGLEGDSGRITRLIARIREGCEAVVPNDPK